MGEVSLRAWGMMSSRLLLLLTLSVVISLCLGAARMNEYPRSKNLRGKWTPSIPENPIIEEDENVSDDDRFVMEELTSTSDDQGPSLQSVAPVTHGGSVHDPCMLSPETFITSKIYVSNFRSRVDREAPGPTKEKLEQLIEQIREQKSQLLQGRQPNNETLGDDERRKLQDLGEEELALFTEKGKLNLSMNIFEEDKRKARMINELEATLNAYRADFLEVPELVEVGWQDWARDSAKLGFYRDGRCALIFSVRGERSEPFTPRDIQTPYERLIQFGPEQIDSSDSNHVAGGNLLVTPSGPILVGNTFGGEEIRDLKKAVDRKVLEIDVSWLHVGHVDEIVSIVPTGSGPDDFVFLIPRFIPRDIALLETLTDSEQSLVSIINTKEQEMFYSIWKEIPNVLNLETYAKTYQKHATKLKQVLAEGFPGIRIYEIPMVYVPWGEQLTVAKSSRLSPNPINHLALRLRKRPEPNEDLEAIFPRPPDEVVEETVLHIVLSANTQMKKDAQLALEQEWEKVFTSLPGNHEVRFVAEDGDNSGGLHCMTLEEKRFRRERDISD